jgi:HSP90 family molecular chaperone
VEVFAGVYEQVTEYKTNCRLEALVNNLEFMMPEKFIDEFNMMMRCKIANKTVLAIDDESVHPNEDEGEQTNQSSMSFEMVRYSLALMLGIFLTSGCVWYFR